MTPFLLEKCGFEPIWLQHGTHAPSPLLTEVFRYLFSCLNNLSVGKPSDWWKASLNTALISEQLQSPKSSICSSDLYIISLYIIYYRSLHYIMSLYFILSTLHYTLLTLIKHCGWMKQQLAVAVMSNVSAWTVLKCENTELQEWIC